MKNVVALLLAVIFSFLLFVLMNTLINTEVKAVETIEIPVIPVNVIKKIDPPKQPPSRKPPPELIKPVTLPAESITSHNENKRIRPVINTAKLPSYTPSTGDNLIERELVPVYQEGNDALMPKVRIEPLYPRKAAMNHIEGNITLKFDINEKGSPVNVKVVNSKPKGYFERNAKKAVRKWKYQPQRENNVAVMVYDQTVTLDFKLEEK